MAQDQSDLYALVKRMQQGDQAALEQLYDLTVGKIYSITLHITNHQALAEETVNDVYLQAWRSASSYEPERAAPLSWLMMLTYSRAIDNLRKETNITKQQIDISDEEIEDVRQVRPLEDALKGEQVNLLRTALNVLDKQQRQLIELAFYHGMSHQELADYTGEPLGTVKTVLRRAQTILRATLNDTFPEVGRS